MKSVEVGINLRHLLNRKLAKVDEWHELWERIIGNVNEDTVRGQTP